MPSIIPELLLWMMPPVLLVTFALTANRPTKSPSDVAELVTSAVALGENAEAAVAGAGDIAKVGDIDSAAAVGPNSANVARDAGAGVVDHRPIANKDATITACDGVAGAAGDGDGDVRLKSVCQ